VIWQLVVQQSENHVIAWAVSAIFVGIAVPLSLHDMHVRWRRVIRCSAGRSYVCQHKLTLTGTLHAFGAERIHRPHTASPRQHIFASAATPADAHGALRVTIAAALHPHFGHGASPQVSEVVLIVLHRGGEGVPG
jgi:hypothetical protein